MVMNSLTDFLKLQSSLELWKILPLFLVPEDYKVTEFLEWRLIMSPAAAMTTMLQYIFAESW